AARSRWIPQSSVPRVVTREVPGVVTAMEDLAEIRNASGLHSALASLTTTYREWVDDQRKVEVGPERAPTQKVLLDRAERAARRIDAGIEALARDPDALEAFRIANGAMAAAARR